MDNQETIKLCEQKAQEWLDSPVYDEKTKAEIREMLDNPDKTELIDSFYQNLTFGTGGLRGIMGPGTNRMNIYTVGGATQGLSNYLKKNFADRKDRALDWPHSCLKADNAQRTSLQTHRNLLPIRRSLDNIKARSRLWAR